MQDSWDVGTRAVEGLEMQTPEYTASLGKLHNSLEESSW